MSETEAFRLEVRLWLQENCPPSMRTPIVPDEMVWGGSGVEFKSEDQRLWFERMRERGWFAPGWPKEYGGGGLDARQAGIVEQEMAAPRLPPAAIQPGHLDARAGAARRRHRRAEARSTCRR